MGDDHRIEYLCQRCQQPLKLDPSLYSIDEHTLAELALPVSPAPDVDLVNQAGSLDRLYLPTKLADSTGNGFTLVGESGQESTISHQLRVTSELFDMLSDNSQVDHPLCEECTDSLLENIERQLELAEQEAQEYQDYLNNLNQETEDSSSVSALETELQQLQLQESQLNQELEDLKREENEADSMLAEAVRRREELEREEERYWREYSRHKHKLLQAEDEYRSLDLQLRTTQNQLEKLKKTNVFNATFHIWHSGHFGTINGFRLGRLPSVPVDWSEVNTAWGQTVLLLYSLCRKINLSLTKYQLVPFGNFSYIKVLAENKELPLYGSGGFKLIWDNKFDSGMAAFLECLQQFKEEVERGDSGFCLPYDMEKGKIVDKATGNSYSVKMQFNSEEQWTKAMKYMLTNLKWGLAWVTSKYPKKCWHRMAELAQVLKDFESLPEDVKEKLAELDLELSEGDITQKGYEKKRNKLLQPFVQAVADKAAAEKAAAQQEAATNSSSSSQQQSPEVSTVKAVPAAASAGAAKASRSGSSASGSTVSSTVDQTSGATIITVPGPTAAASAPDQAAAAANKPRSRRTHKRYYNEKRYHSEVRQEAVQQALAALHDKPKQVVPLPSKRASVAPAPPAGEDDDSSSGDDDGDGLQDTEDTEGSTNNLVVETRNLALGMSDTSSNNSLASGGPTRPPPPLPNPGESPASKPLPPSPQDDVLPPPPPPARQVSSTNSGTYTRDPTRKRTSSDGSSAGIRSSSAVEQQQAVPPPLPPQHHHSTPPTPPPPERVELRRRDDRQRREGESSRDSHQDSRHSRDVPSHQQNKRSSLIETETKPSTTNNKTTANSDLVETNLEPYDVLILSNETALKAKASSHHQHHQSPHQHGLISSSTPDVALPGLRHQQSGTPPPPLPPPMKSQYRHSAHVGSVRVSTGKYSHPSIHDSHSDIGTASRWKVSAKIQQLLNTLKKPKRRPLPEFYEDDDVELEIAARNKDPNAPSPEGSNMSPAVGSSLVIPAGLPRNLEAAIQRYGSATYKAPVATVLDPNGKLTITLTYGKLLSRSHKIAYALLNKIGLTGNNNGKEGMSFIKPGDRVALVYPNNDPLNMICAFYGCVMAGAVPVPIEVPLTRRDAGSQQIGFLLGSCNVSLALTSEACFKGLPKSANGDVTQFKGWPKLNWFITEHLARPPKEWNPPPRLTDETPAYVEYTTQQDGSVLGVSVSRTAMLAMARSLTLACGYTEGEIMVCVLDFKRDAGLWHAVIASVFNGMHVIFIPYSLMKVNPASWMQMITKHRATIAVCKSRDLHWGLLATKDHRDINLASLRLLLVADGANPWSLSSCDQFLTVFQSKGLRAEAICPCASSAEGLTVSVRRPGREGVNATGRGVLSMSALSYGVVRVDQENSLTSLTLQDCGQVLPGSVIVIVRMDGSPVICKTDEVGEILVSSSATATSYWGLPGLSQNIFKVRPETEDGKPVGDGDFVRTGLLGFLGPGGLVFVCGSRDGLMTVSGRKHNTDDIIATVLAVEPMKFIYRGRIAVFSITVLRDDRICVVAEQRPDCSEEESFQWMSRVLQAVDSIHTVGLYCLALVPHNHLPKTPLGGIHLSETKKRFLEGTLHPVNVLMCPHTCVTNLPKPREIHTDVGPASVIVGNLVQGNRLAEASGRDIGGLEDETVGGEPGTKKHQFIGEILRWRAQATADHVLFSLLNNRGVATQTLTCSQLHKKAERIACLLLEKGRLNTGDHVALIYPPGVDLIAAFYGCLYVGVVPVTIRPPHPQNLQTTLPTVRMIVDVSKSVVILSSSQVIKLLKSKEASNVVDIKSWCPTLDTDELPRRKLPGVYRAPTPELLAYLDFSVSTTGMLAGIKMSHASTTALCRAMKLQCELYPSRHVALCLDPYCGLGFALWCLSSVYSGHHTILIPPSEVEANPGLWLTAVSQYKVRDTFCSYGVMELCTRGLGGSVAQLKSRGVQLSCVRTLVVVAEERPRIALCNSFTALFAPLGLSLRAVSTSFGCRQNIAICLQGASSPDPSTVYVDLRALRHDRVTLVERGAPHSLPLMESGKLLPGMSLVIADPETKGQCGDSNLGEIWVECPHNSTGYYTIYGEDATYNDHFAAKLSTGSNTRTCYARTGYLGFLRRTQSIGCDGEQHDAVFVVGALDETMMLRGMRYHPIDIENSVLRSHKKIAECAVFTWTNLLVVVAELDGGENEALDLVPLVTNIVLEDHQLIVGIVVIADPGTVPINSRGEKQRMHLRDGFLADQLDPIYVAYNM